MNIEKETLDGGIVKIELAGELDARGAEEIEQKLMDYATAHRSVILDLNAVSVLTSMGIRTLLLVAKAVSRRGGKIVLLTPDSNVRKGLEAARLDTLIPIRLTLDEARSEVSV
jgi:anti-anti-sigma factor